MNQFALYTAPGGPLLSDYSHRIRDLSVASNGRGAAEATGFIPMSLAEAFQFYDRAGLPHVMFNGPGSDTIYEGRLEDVSIVPGGIKIGAYGYARCLMDIPYTALWSAADNYSEWRPETSVDSTNFSESLYQMDTSGRLYITAQKNATLGTTGTLKAGGLIFRIPDSGVRSMVGIQFNYSLNTPANWVIRCDAPTIATIWNGDAQAGTGTVNGAFCGTFTASPAINFYIYRSLADAVNASETGAIYLRITNLRIVTTTVNMVNTTQTAGTAAGTHVSVPVVTTANMYVGQRLFFGATGGANIGDWGIVESITDSTHVVMDNLNAAHANGLSVKAMVVYGDEIVKEMLSTVNAVSGGSHLSAATTQIQAPNLDLFHEDYEDRAMTDIMDYLVGLGDNQAAPRQWEWFVDDGRVLTFQPQGASANTWYVDAADGIEVNRTMDTLANSMYAVYQDAYDKTARSAVSNDQTSITRYGIVRRQALATRTTSATQAGVQLAAALADRKDPRPRSGIAITRVYDAAGNRWPLTAVRAGDTIVVRNLPPLLSLTTDQSRSFRLARVSYAVDTDALTIEPEVALPTLDALLARLSAGLSR